METRPALITGVTGHLGSAIARALAARLIDVHGLTRSGGKDSDFPSCSASMHHFDGDTSNLVELFRYLQPGTVFHVAGLSKRTHSCTDTLPFVNANILLGAQLLEAMRASSCRSLITAGTYLQHYKGHDRRPMNLYAATKQAFETLAEYYCDAYGISVVRLTLSDIYSEHDTRRNLMTDIRKAWVSGHPLVLRNPNACVDLLHVEDAAHAFVRASEILAESGNHLAAVTRYSVSSQRSISAEELVAKFERIGSGKITVLDEGTSPPCREMAPWSGELVPGWTPSISIERGIERIIAQARRHQSPAQRQS